MANKKGRVGSRNSGTGRKPAARPRFSFEAGEQSLPLGVKVTHATFPKDKVQIPVTGKLLEGSPAHLRVLGQRVTVSSLTSEVSFVVGPDVKKAHTYTVAAGGEPPKLTLVGEEDTTVSLVYKGVCLYKNS